MAYASWDPANKSARITLSGSDLVATGDNSASYCTVIATLPKASGQWYCELTITDLGYDMSVGLAEATWTIGDANVIGTPADGTSYAYTSAGQKVGPGGQTGYGASYTDGDVISIVFDADANTLVFWKNGSTQGTAYSSVTQTLAIAITGRGNGGAVIPVVTANFGGSVFAYTPPTGFVGPGDGAVTLTFAKSAPKPALITGFDGVVATAPKPALSALIPIEGGNFTAPAPTLVATSLTGTISTISLSAAVPTLSAQIPLSTSFGLALTAPAPKFSSAVLAGNVVEFIAVAPKPALSAVYISPSVITLDLTAPAPRLVTSGLTGNTASVIVQAVVPILQAAGFSAGTITLALTAPAPRLFAELVSAASSTYRTWCMNVRKGAVTEYTNFNFDSFAYFNGQVIAVNSSGVVVLDSSKTDAGTTITGKARTGKASYGSSYLKRVPRIYVGVESEGDLLFRTITTEGGERTYRLADNHNTGVQQRRVPIGRGPKSRYWQFEIEGSSDFSVDDMLVYPVVLRRRVQ